VTSRTEASVVVVGAGPVGLAMAAELSRHGVKCRIIDENPAPAGGTRAIAVQARTLEILDDIGVIRPVLDAGHRIHGASIFAVDRRILHFTFDELASPYSFALDLPQRETERILADHLGKLGIAVERSTTVTGIVQTTDGVTLYVDGPSAAAIETAYAVGCDGARSAIRALSDFPSEGIPVEESFLVADVRIDWNAADDEWYFWFHESGLFSLFPLGEEWYRVVVEVRRGTRAAEDELRSAFANRGPKNANILEAKPDCGL
jgi:2-polyprenyl-6-methoxyphenol hydroxylase-like FAD-dependent oxidoreductase